MSIKLSKRLMNHSTDEVRTGRGQGFQIIHMFNESFHWRGVCVCVCVCVGGGGGAVQLSTCLMIFFTEGMGSQLNYQSG